MATEARARDIERGTAGEVTRHRKRIDLGVWAAETFMMSCTDKLTVANDDGTYHGIRLDRAFAVSGLGQSMTHPLDVFFCGEDSSHAPRLDLF